ncbi:MAG TPA: hypothetical protein VN281_23540 [Verrucomicrobiae bacterium]|nr:hypothetical protein [Verrucomicrobiae bacterium]
MSASNEKDLFKVMKFSTALAFGALLASLESLRSSPAGFSFQLSYKTLLAFLIGAGIAMAYWSLVLRCGAVARRTGVVVGTILLALFGIGAFLYPLRFVPREKLPDILIGLGLAACALSGVGGLLWGARRFLNADSQATEEKE